MRNPDEYAFFGKDCKNLGRSQKNKSNHNKNKKRRDDSYLTLIVIIIFLATLFVAKFLNGGLHLNL